MLIASCCCTCNGLVRNACAHPHLLKHAADAEQSAISNRHAALFYHPMLSLMVQYLTCGCVRNSAVLKFEVPLKLISGSKPV